MFTEREVVAVVVLVCLEQQLLLKQEAEPAQDGVRQCQDVADHVAELVVLPPHFQLQGAFLV